MPLDPAVRNGDPFGDTNTASPTAAPKTVITVSTIPPGNELTRIDAVADKTFLIGVPSLILIPPEPVVTNPKSAFVPTGWIAVSPFDATVNLQ